MTYQFRNMTRSELDETLSWAGAEGWNPGLDDAPAFWAADPEGFLAIERDGQLVGTGAIISYGGVFGFMGLFMVKPEARGQGLGRDFWYYRRDTLKARLQDNAPIALDGVEAMQSFYAKGGFQKTHDHVRYSFRPSQLAPPSIPPGARLFSSEELNFSQLAAYDRLHFGADRAEFLKLWLRPKRGRARVLVDQRGEIVGLGVIRAAYEGYRIGPLFADHMQAAEVVLGALVEDIPSELIFIDIPSINLAAQTMITKLGLQAGFRCARMYLGAAPQVPWQKIFGVSSLELG